MDTQIIIAILNASSTFVLFVTAIILAVQMTETRRSTKATAFKSVYDLLQADDIRTARGIVMGVLDKKKFNNWTKDELLIAEKVCHSYDSVGIMTRNGMIPVKIVADSWGASLRKSWKILSPLVTSYRIQRNSAEFWDDFEWLARKAEKFQKPMHV